MDITLAPEVEDWSFAELKRTETLWGPHGYHRYPAKFIPQLVRRIIDRFAIPGDLIGDVFMGSGTTGIEALRTGHRFYGADINEVACLIGRAKCIPIEPTKLNQLCTVIEKALAEIPRIGRRQLTVEEKHVITSINIGHATREERFHYWFPEAHRVALAAILEEIMGLAEGQQQIFLLCAFSNVLRRCSIWLSGSTKPQKEMSKTLGDPVEEFTKQLRDMVKRNHLYWNELKLNGFGHFPLGSCEIDQADVRQLPLPDEALDLLITSPPYATCYQYHDLHQLTQLWLERYDALPQAMPKEAWIGSEGISIRDTKSDSSTSLVPPSAIIALEELKQKASGRFKTDILAEAKALEFYFHDMTIAVGEIARVVKRGKRLVLIIGDSKRRDVAIPTTQAICEMALSSGFELEHCIERRIPGRVLVSTRDRRTGRFSSTAESDMRAYPEENILVFRRMQS